MNPASQNSILIYREQESPASNQWKGPLRLAIVLHVLALTSAMVMPGLFKTSFILPEVYTVNLLDTDEIETRPATPQPLEQKKVTAPPPAAAPQEIKAPAKLKAELKIKTAEPKAPVTPALPDNQLSINPIKKKVQLAAPADIKYKKKLEEVRKVKELEQIRAEQEFARTKKIAEQETQDALKKLRQSLIAGNAARTPKAAAGEPPATANAGAAGSSDELDEIMRHYYPLIEQHIGSHWILPDLQDWDTSLKAVLVINVRQDGMITKSFFEKKSNNIFFNQFVMKTVRDASPLPPFPPELKETSIEIGLVFSPGGLI